MADDVRAVARRTIARFICDEVYGPEYTPLEGMYEQADAIIERLADEGLLIYDTMAEEFGT